MKCLQNRLIALFAIGLTYCVIGTHVTRAEPEDAGALLSAAESEDDLVNEGSREYIPPKFCIMPRR